MKIHSKVKDYSFAILRDSLDNKKKVFGRNMAGKPFYFVDRNVYRLYKGKIDKFTGKDFKVIIEAKESNKEYIKLAEYFSGLIAGGFTRNDMLVTIGGGILQDISGFIASTLYRGIKWIFIPTTLLAQADSCIGSKTSINFGDSKNLIGTFYPPDSIYIDTGFCRTLTEEYFNSGLGEIIKFHLMSDEKGYSRLKKYLASGDLRNDAKLEKVIISTLAIKKSYFDGDEFDTGKRNLLNYGHCFGHALESASGFAVCHGEAVISGMGFANLLSFKRGVMSADCYEEFERILRKHYPRFDMAGVDAGEIIKYMKRDKKRIGKDLTVILSKGIGDQLKVDDVKEEEVKQAYSEFVNIGRRCRECL